MQGSPSKAKPLRVDLESLNQVLTFVEQYLALNTTVRPTFDDEFKETTAPIPSRLHAEIKVATRSLLTERRKPKGRLLVVTGLEKAGKETQISNPSKLGHVTPLTEWLGKRNLKVMTTETLYGNAIGALLGNFLGRASENLLTKGSFNRKLAWILWSLERAPRSARWVDWLDMDERNVLVAKRWTESDLAYHSTWGVEPSRILEFERNLLKPDHTVVLDASVDEVERRRGDHSQSQTYSLGDLRAVKAAFLQLPQSYPYGSFAVVDADRSPTEVNASLIEALGPYFP